MNSSDPNTFTGENLSTDRPLSASIEPGPATATRNAPTASATTTLTITQSEAQPRTDEVLRLTLRARPAVTWDESVVDNEGLGRKSSKRCCIFHKQRKFGESSSESSDDGNVSDGSSSSGGPGSGKPKAIARKKQGKLKQSVPDYQRFHA